MDTRMVTSMTRNGCVAAEKGHPRAPLDTGRGPRIVDCPSVDKFADYLAGNLDDEGSAEVFLHISRCERCQLEEMAFRTALLASSQREVRHTGSDKSRRP
jgi:hypothetical protein